MKQGRPVYRHFLGISEPVWRILIAGGVAALWMLVAWTATAYGNDCAAYVQNPKNFTGNLQGLIEDCMRTGYVQAITTLLVGGIGGGGIVIAVNKGLKAAEKGYTEPGGGSGKAEGGHCGFCGAAMASGGTKCPECSKEKASCRKCSKRFWSADKDPLCPTCFAARPPEPDPGPTKPNPYEPKPDPQDAIDRCGFCTAEMPKGATTCPTCSKEKATCRKCGKRVWSAEADPVCPSCAMTPRAPQDGPTKPNPDEPKADPGDAEDPPRPASCANCGAALPPGAVTCPDCDEPTGKTDPDEPAEPEPKPPPAPQCPRCGADLPVGGTADGRCPTCGAKQPTSTETTGPSTKLPGDGSSPPVTLAGDPGSPTTPVTLTQSAGGTPPGTPATGTTAPAGATPAGGTTPDPPFTQEGVISGDKAAELLEQAGLGKITRDATGKVIKVEEAFPGAFTNLGGQTVTIKGGETTGGGLGQDFVELSKGKVTGIGVKPNGELAIVVNHSEPKWEQRPATPAEIAAKFIQDAQAAAARASQAVTDAAKSAEKAYTDLKKKLDDADFARNMYKIDKFATSPAEAEQRMRAHAIKNGLDPDEVMYMVKLDNTIWDAIKAGVKLPDTLRGK